MSKVTGHNSFSSVLASSSCVNTIIETYVDHEVFNAINMMNAVRADKKHLLLFVSTFKETMFKNITINYAVTIQHSAGGDFNITTDRYNSSWTTSFNRSNCHTLPMPGIGREAFTGVQGSVPISFTKPFGKKDRCFIYIFSTLFSAFSNRWDR